MPPLHTPEFGATVELPPSEPAAPPLPYWNWSWKPEKTGESQRSELQTRSSKPPFAFVVQPCAHSDAVPMMLVSSVGLSPKISWMLSYGAWKRPMRNVPQLPCRPTNESRPASVPVPLSGLTEFSIWKIAFSPPPSDSVPRRPKREEFELTRNCHGFVTLHPLIVPALCPTVHVAGC